MGDGVEGEVEVDADANQRRHDSIIPKRQTLRIPIPSIIIVPSMQIHITYDEKHQEPHSEYDISQEDKRLLYWTERAFRMLFVLEEQHGDKKAGEEERDDCEGWE